MPYLRKRDTGAVTDWLGSDSVEYQVLKGVRFQADATAASGPATSGLIAGETPGTIKAGQPVWEDIAEEDAAEPDPTGGHVGVVALGSAATASAETTSDEDLPQYAGTLTDVEYVPNANITGQATNNRVITLQQATLAGTTTVTRTVTSLAAITFGAGVNATAGVPVALTISTAAFVSGYPITAVSSVNGTGLADPGGVVYYVYTRA